LHRGIAPSIWKRLMPEINFVLPHWLYWSTLLLFPLIAVWLYRHAGDVDPEKPVSIALAYFFWLTGGFLGVHRLYLKSNWAGAFVVLFVTILMINVQARDARDGLSGAANAVSMSESRIKRGERNIDKAEKRLQRRDNDRNRKRLADAEQAVRDARGRLAEAQEELRVAEVYAQRWSLYAHIAAGLVLLLLTIDAFLLPRLVRARNAIERAPDDDRVCLPCAETVPDFVVDHSKPPFERYVSWVNAKAGEFVAYWSIIAVFAYYYEVIVRYVFNSPTNWAHEGMFLMFGMQYLIAGGFCLRENAHVRVDVVYMHLSEKHRALADLITSVFFFIFTATLLVTGWIFFHDSYSIGEVSFTEWHIQYYPIKFALPLGALLLMLQGIVRLLNDINAYRGIDHLPPELHRGA
jgi:TRAP-type mannitol/chloroaromatic compound transport system permease small subunit